MGYPADDPTTTTILKKLYTTTSGWYEGDDGEKDPGGTGPLANRMDHYLGINGCSGYVGGDNKIKPDVTWEPDFAGITDAAKEYYIGTTGYIKTSLKPMEKEVPIAPQCWGGLGFGGTHFEYSTYNNTSKETVGMDFHFLPDHLYIEYSGDLEGPKYLTTSVSVQPQGTSKMCWQDDGNLAIYNNNVITWQTNTKGAGREFVIRTDCNLVIREPSTYIDSKKVTGKVLWDTGTNYCDWTNSHNVDREQSHDSIGTMNTAPVADADSDTLTAVKNTGPTNGALTLSSDGSFTYKPTANYCGSDSFTYHANDGTADSNVATVSLTVNCVNDASNFTASNPVSVNEDSGAQTATVASSFSAGPANESTQIVNGYIISGVTNGSLLSAGPTVNNSGVLSYTPAANAFGTVSFGLQVKDSGGTANGGVDTSTKKSVTITINPVNDMPVAYNNSYSHNEDTQLTGNVISQDTGSGLDSDVDGDGLTIQSNSKPSHGTLVLQSTGAFTYNPKANYCGPDSFTYVATDAPAATAPSLNSNTATVTIKVNCVNDAPVITSVSPTSQSADYSDWISTVTITAYDVDSTNLTLSQSGAPASLPNPSLASTRQCKTVSNDSTEDGSSCSWTFNGQVTASGDLYDIYFTVNDGSLNSTAVQHALKVFAELATVSFDGSNPVSVKVAEPSGGSGSFGLSVFIREMQPDQPDNGLEDFGDIKNAEVSMQLKPIAQGGSQNGICTQVGVTGTGYEQVLEVSCAFDDVPVNTYAIETTVDGGYYQGFGEDVFTVFDPSLGFTSGGGWFYWPETANAGSGYPGDRTNFGYTMKYNKKATKVQGSLLLIRHLEVDDKYRIKSNALYGLALGENTIGVDDYGWASFNCKSTYLEPGMEDPEGNHQFIFYVEDHSEHGSDKEIADKVWLEVRNKDGMFIEKMSLDYPADLNEVDLKGGNIVVPHGGR